MMIQENTVYIWHLDLNSLQKSPRELINYLTNDELERHASYVFDIHREQFAKRRYLLKSVLALYLERDVKQVRLSRHAGGKPYLCHNVYKSDITFNYSHSGECVVVAIAKNNPVGVDVEKIDAIAKIGAIAKMIMSEAEYHQFCQADGKRKLQTFYRLWSRKESVVKALGTGLSYPIWKLEFLDLGKGKNTVTLDEADHKTSRWHVYDIELCDTHSSAFATQKDIERIVIKDNRDILNAL